MQCKNKAFQSRHRVSSTHHYNYQLIQELSYTRNLVTVIIIFLCDTLGERYINNNFAGRPNDL